MNEDFVAMRRSLPDSALLKEGDRAVAIGIRDTGGGIPSEIADKIFDPFFTTKGPGEGTGLGLAIAHGIVEAHGGRIWVENPGDGGALFKILLPETEDSPLPVHLIAPHGRLQVPKARAFADFAVPRLKAHFARLRIDADRAAIQPQRGRKTSE